MYRTHQMYVQDDWRVSKRLTLNLGLRYEINLAPIVGNDMLSDFDPTVPNPGAGGRRARWSSPATVRAGRIRVRWRRTGRRHRAAARVCLRPGQQDDHARRGDSQLSDRSSILWAPRITWASCSGSPSARPEPGFEPAFHVAGWRAILGAGAANRSLRRQRQFKRPVLQREDRQPGDPTS